MAIRDGVKVYLALNKQLIFDTTRTTFSDPTRRRPSIKANNGFNDKRVNFN